MEYREGSQAQPPVHTEQAWARTLSTYLPKVHKNWAELVGLWMFDYLHITFNHWEPCCGISSPHTHCISDKCHWHHKNKGHRAVHAVIRNQQEVTRATLPQEPRWRWYIFEPGALPHLCYHSRKHKNHHFPCILIHLPKVEKVLSLDFLNVIKSWSQESLSQQLRT